MDKVLLSFLVILIALGAFLSIRDFNYEKYKECEIECTDSIRVDSVRVDSLEKLDSLMIDSKIE